MSEEFKIPSGTVREPRIILKKDGTLSLIDGGDLTEYLKRGFASFNEKCTCDGECRCEYVVSIDVSLIPTRDLNIINKIGVGRGKELGMYRSLMRQINEFYAKNSDIIW